jgi:hypothetical protein
MPLPSKYAMTNSRETHSSEMMPRSRNINARFELPVSGAVRMISRGVPFAKGVFGKRVCSCRTADWASIFIQCSKLTSCSHSCLHSPNEAISQMSVISRPCRHYGPVSSIPTPIPFTYLYGACMMCYEQCVRSCPLE